MTDFEPNFTEVITARAARLGRLCVGIDPHPKLLEAWNLSPDIQGLRTFALTCAEAFADTAAVVKPQVAFFESFGSSGYRVLEETISYLRNHECPVIADAKRGDIGSTMDAYARAWLEPGSPLESDAVTVSPYLGFGALEPALFRADRYGKGVFVLAATSNPEAYQLQNSPWGAGDGSVTVRQAIVDECAARNAALGEKGRPGTIGVVIGATLSSGPKLDALNGPVLLPGVGAQGGTSESVDALCRGVTTLAWPSVSRQVLQCGPSAANLRSAVTEAASAFPLASEKNNTANNPSSA